MTRIIGGSAGGRRLQTPRGAQTRPTSDRVREALFSSLESTVGSLHGLRFLDLYAGSGAVGLEAMSRGAIAVTLVEQDRRTAGVIRSNVAALGFRDATVVCGVVARVLAGGPHGPAYDVVFVDPPYALAGAAVSEDLAALVEHGWLADRATVVVERSSRDMDLVWPEACGGLRTRTYGETGLVFGGPFTLR